MSTSLRDKLVKLQAQAAASVVVMNQDQGGGGGSKSSKSVRVTPEPKLINHEQKFNAAIISYSASKPIERSQ